MTHTTKRLKVYSASAGSGKTFTLTAEYLRYALKNPEANYRRILAITFTNKATQEMKERILEASEAFSQMPSTPLSGRNEQLWNKVQADTGYTDEDLATRAGVLFTHILHDYSDFAVSTIDSFSQRIIRAFALELNVPINFEVILESEETLRVLRDRLVNMVGRDDDVSSLLKEIMLSNLAEYDRFDIRREIYESAEILTQDESINYFDELERIKTKDIVRIVKKLTHKRGELVNRLKENARQSLDMLNSIGIPLREYCGSSPFHSAYFKILNGAYDDAIKKTFIQTIEGTKNYFKKTSKQYEEEVEHIKPEISSLGFQIIDDCRELANLDFIYKNLSRTALLSYLRKLYKIYQHEEDILLISEFNQLIYEKVKGEPAPFIYEKIGEQYDYFLIDEFQDTSVMQFHNIVPLLTETLSVATQPESLIVGDSKQAIYRFRGGEITQLTKLPKLVGSETDPILQEHEAILTQHMQRASLPVNYRSKQVIVDFNNRLFDFVKHHPELEAFREVYEDSRQEVFHRDSGGYVEIKSYASISTRTPPDKKDEIRAERLNDMLEVVGDAVSRGYDLRDIAILTRGKKDLQITGEILTNAGYEVVSSESLLLANDFSIAVFPLLYQYIINPENEITQLEIMTKFHMIGLLDGNLHGLNQALKSAPSFEKFMNEQQVRIDISRLAQLSIIEGWEYFAARLPQEAIKPAMHGYFRESIYEFVRNFGNDLDHFVLWWEEKKEKLSIETSEEISGIRMMTIHKSKGLEFPVVIMPFANWKIKKDDKEWVQVNHKDFKPLNVIYANISSKVGELESYTEAYNQKIENVILDNLNLLYVACTRAAAELYIFSEELSANSRKDLHLGAMSNIKALLEVFSKNNPIKYGEKTQAPAADSPQNNKLTLHYETGRMARIDIKSRSKTIWNEEVLDKIAYGSIVHNILENIDDEASMNQAIDQAIKFGWITKAERQKIYDMIYDIVTHPVVSKYFDKTAELKMETSILTPEGTIFIPDRLLFDNKKVYVLDFKSGSPQKKHEKQINAYADLVTGMGYIVQERVLVYTDPLEVKILEA